MLALFYEEIYIKDFILNMGPDTLTRPNLFPVGSNNQPLQVNLLQDSRATL